MQFNYFKKIISALSLLRLAFGNYKRQIAVLGVIGFISGLLEGVGINAIIPLFSLVSEGAFESNDIISRWIVGFIEFLGLGYNFTVLAIFIACLFILKAMFIYAGNYLNARITSNYEKQMRKDLFKEMLRSNWPHLLEERIGHLEKVLMDHIGRASQALQELSSAILLASGLFMYVVVAINISPNITFITLGLGAVMFLFLKPVLYRTRIASTQLSEIGKQSANLINEHMIGIKTIKSMAVERAVLDRADGFFDQLRWARIRLASQEALTNSFIQPFSIIFVLIVFGFTYRSPDFNFASFAVILYLIQKMFVYIQNAQGKMQALVGYVPYLRSVIVYKEKAVQNREPQVGTDGFTFEREIALKKVSFQYHSGKNAVLNDISFSVRRGEMVGLIGPSGAGKTTIVDLLLRLLKPDSGVIEIDGKNIGQISMDQWRKKVAYVSQDIFLLNDTIENNIRFYDNNISKQRVIEAAKMANLYDFVMTQPKKFQTAVGERGLALSGGQRQRVILARALARSPKILILDEATSALDNESEILVQKSIEDLKGKITVLAIAHRLTTVVNSDRLIVLENGNISEIGAPEKLLKDKESYFYKVYNIREA